MLILILRALTPSVSQFAWRLETEDLYKHFQNYRLRIILRIIAE